MAELGSEADNPSRTRTLVSENQMPATPMSFQIKHEGSALGNWSRVEIVLLGMMTE